MKVWLVFYAHDYVIAAYSTEEKAEAWVAKAEREHPSSLSYSAYDIMEIDVDEDPRSWRG